MFKQKKLIVISNTIAQLSSQTANVLDFVSGPDYDTNYALAVNLKCVPDAFFALFQVLC